ncbi:MAG: hypothetical protein Q7R43_01660 [Candidatus Daviesbacteria bacterium]|nr:hypothetical protein [Candidatus Daviesbacteria bacterium]
MGKGYAGVELSVALFSNSGILHNTSVSFFNQIVPQIEKRMFDDLDFSYFANLVNAKYYLLRFDIDYESRLMTNPKTLEKRLEERMQNGEVKKVAEFGKVQIWENLSWKDNTFYPAIKLITMPKIDKNTEIITDINILNGEVLVDSKDLDSQTLVNKRVNNNLQISYKKIDLTKYLVHVKNANEPFVLVFSELFNNDWKAFHNNGQSLDKHFRANLYANGWLVDRKGDFDIRVEFPSQKWMDWGEKISFLSLTLLIFLTGFILLRFKKVNV